MEANSLTGFSSAGSPDLARFQMLKAIKTQFYIHKSFDIQSDKEFLPSMPNEYDHIQHNPYGQATPSLYHIPRKQASSAVMISSPNTIPASMQYSRSVDFSNGSPSPSTSSLQINELLKTPKNRALFTNQSSPKNRNPNGGIALRKRISSGPQQPQHQPFSIQQSQFGVAATNSNLRFNNNNETDNNNVNNNTNNINNNNRNW